MTLALVVSNSSSLVHLAPVDMVIIAFYFALVLAIGFYLKGRANTGEDFFMAGREMTLLEIRYPPGAGAPPHIHLHETLCYVVSGSVHVSVGDEEFDMLPGDVCRHPQGVPHAIRGIEHATVLEVKSPAQPLAAFLSISEE